MKRLMMNVFPLVMVVGLLVSTVIIFTALQAAPAAINGPAAFENVGVVQTVDPLHMARNYLSRKGALCVM